MTEPTGPDPALLAIIAHGLLSDTAVIGTAASMLEELWDSLAPELHRRLLQMIIEHSGHLTEVLDGLARGLPPEVILSVPEAGDR